MLEPKFLISENADSLSAHFTNTAGDYSASNTGGFGTPNMEKASVTAAVLTCTFPTSAFEIGTTTVAIDLFALGYPSVDELDIANTLFGLAADAELADGPHQFDLVVTGDEDGNEVDREYSWVAWFRNGKICCVTKLVTAYEKPCDCEKPSKDLLKIIYAKLDLYSISGAEDCQNVDAGTTAMQHLNDLCNGISDCGCH